MSTVALLPERTKRRTLSLLDDSAGAPSLVAGARGDVSALGARERALRADFGVAVVSMPFQSTSTPSIQLGLLRAIGESHGFPVETFHLNLEFARRVDFAFFDKLCAMRGRLIGDWFFSVAAFRDQAPDLGARFVKDFAYDIAAQFDDIENGKVAPTVLLRHRLTALRIRDEVVPAFLDAMMAQNDWGRFKVVGFSSVFQQTVASFALARRIKEAHPNVQIVFGGSNFDDEMGLEFIRQVPWIDHAVVGEGDVAFPELLVALSEGKETGTLKGVASRRPDGQVAFGGKRKLLEDLDQLPTPRYEEYFSRAEATGLLTPQRRRTTRLPFESARGCWWGEKHHCTFCGLNNNGMKFRSKSPDRVADEIAELARTNRSYQLSAVDNIIQNDYMKTLLPRLVAEERDYTFFYEVKSNLTREQIKGMRAAGIMHIQPGIESLSSNVLRLMRKGVTAAQNVNTLRWAMYYGVHVGWNVLWGFPGETTADYEEQTRLIPKIIHLLPPGNSGGPIWMERFSPIFTDSEAFPLEYRRPEASYGYVYPTSIDADKIAYFFEYKLKNTLPADVYVPLSVELAKWIHAWKDYWPTPGNGFSGTDVTEAAEQRKGTKPTLTYFYSEDFLQIADLRGTDRASFTFEGPLARLYKSAVDRPVTAQKAMESAGPGYSVSDVERVLNDFCERGVMMRDGEKFLSLALPAITGR